jgi:hypothetical protein
LEIKPMKTYTYPMPIQMPAQMPAQMPVVEEKPMVSPYMMPYQQPMMCPPVVSPYHCAPIAPIKHHKKYAPCSSPAEILVLFVLLVIILRAFVGWK